jgi:hypothetical protein
MINSKRIGRVKISINLINDIPEAVQLVMSVFIPLKAEIFPQGWIEYIGICEQFDERDDGFITPQYDFDIVRNEDGKYSIKEVNKIQ